MALKLVIINIASLVPLHYIVEFCVYLGKMKCMSKTGDCLVKHPAGFATGMSLVVIFKYCWCA